MPLSLSNTTAASTFMTVFGGLSVRLALVSAAKAFKSKLAKPPHACGLGHV